MSLKKRRSIFNEYQTTNFSGKSAGEGYFSQDGKFLIFQSERDPENPFYQIYMMNLETGTRIEFLRDRKNHVFVYSA